MSDYILHHGDCLEVMPTLAAGSVDAVICDPPYGTTACKWDSVIPFAPMWEQITRLLKPRGACVLFGSQPFTSALVMSNPAWFRYEWVWEKTNAVDFMTAKIRPRKMHENIVVFSDGAHTYNPQMLQGKAYIDKPRKRTNNVHNSTMPKLGIVNNGTRYPESIIAVRNPNNDTVHPTQKPLALLEYLVKTYTDKGDTVLDFTMGSGTTGHACMNLGRRFIGIEQDAAYFALAQERIADAADPLRHMIAQEVPQ
jgi:site-specific DNA-methyltransferase (adenine-specific)